MTLYKCLHLFILLNAIHHNDVIVLTTTKHLDFCEISAIMPSNQVAIMTSKYIASHSFWKVCLVFNTNRYRESEL